MTEEKMFNMLLELLGPEVEAAFKYDQWMLDWMTKWTVLAPDMEEMNRKGLVKTWMVLGYMCGTDEKGSGGLTVTPTWSYVGGIDSEEYRQKMQWAEENAYKRVLGFIQQRNRDREERIKYEWEFVTEGMIDEERKFASGVDLGPSHTLLYELPEMKHFIRLLPKMFGYSLTEAGLAWLYETFEKWIIGQKALRLGFMRLRKVVSDVWTPKPVFDSVGTESVFMRCIGLKYLVQKTEHGQAFFRWSTTGVDFENRVRKAIKEKRQQEETPVTQTAKDARNAKPAKLEGI